MSHGLNRRSGPASLVELAQLGELPRHQYMDAETLRWIEQHQPQFSGGEVPLPERNSDLLRIPERWFADTKLVQSIHGLRHHTRVAIYAGHLADWLGLQAFERCEAVLAAAIHDCRRHHDQYDPGHGARTAAWFEQASDAVRGLLLTDVMARNEVVSVAIELHDVPRSEFSKAQLDRYRRAPEVVDIVQAADALDRYRLPKLKWWPDPGRMTLQPPLWLYELAWRLVVATERRELADSAEAAKAFRVEAGWIDGAL